MLAPPVGEQGSGPGVMVGHFIDGLQSRDELVLPLSGARFRGDDAVLRLVAEGDGDGEDEPRYVARSA